MAWNDLKASVAAVIRTNGTQAITGTVLQSTLNSIIDQVGANSTFKGVATPSTNPGTPDGNLFYFAHTSGSYPNFGLYIPEGTVGIIKNDGPNWSFIDIKAATHKSMMEIKSEIDLGATSTSIYNMTAISQDEPIYCNAFPLRNIWGIEINAPIGTIELYVVNVTTGVATLYKTLTQTVWGIQRYMFDSVLNLSTNEFLGTKGRVYYTFTDENKAVKRAGTYERLSSGTVSFTPRVELGFNLIGSSLKDIVTKGLKDLDEEIINISETVNSITDQVADQVAALVPHVIFDISEYNAIDGMAKAYASLPDALVDVPAIAKHGGMSIKYVQSSDNEYVQYRLKSDTFNTTPANWQGVDDEPIAGSENLVKSGGVYNAIESLAGFQEQDKFSISDEQGYNIVDFENEHIKTKGFNSEEAAVSKLALKSFSISDGEGYSIVDFEDGDIKTKNFDSSKIRNSPPAGTLKLPVSYIPVYITCNDLNTSSKCGIGTRNKSVNIYLDHFFHTDRELNVVFENGSTFYTVTQSIEEGGDVWNRDLVKCEFQEELNVNEDTLKIKVRSILNSETLGIYPKVLQIGDSVTQGWFANYPRVNNAPVQSFSWAKYYFLKDAEQAGGNYKSLFVGRGSNTEFSYDGVSGIAYAEGKGGKTAKWYVTNPDSPFYAQNGFSLLSYLHKYKTLDIDGETRLVVGSTAGTEVTDVMSWDLCTPNVVVIQLGMNDVLSEWKTYMPQIVNSIKTEFPDMKVIISVLDGCTCNYPSLYPNYQNIFFDNYNNNHTKLMEAYCYALDNWQDEENGVYVLYSGMVMPMPMSCNVRETDGSFDGSIKRYIGVDSYERVPHPSRYAHQEIGYLLYSCIKWILS